MKKITDYFTTIEKKEIIVTSKGKSTRKVSIQPAVYWKDLPINRVVASNLESMGYKGPLDHQLKALSLFYDICVPSRLEIPHLVRKRVKERSFHKQFKKILLSFDTSAGKTLVAILFIDYLLQEDGGKMVYCVPFKALAEEMFDTFTKCFKGVYNVGISTGDYSAKKVSNLISYDVLIITYDKLNSLLSKDADGELRSVITGAVLDEFHMADKMHAIEDVVIKVKHIDIPLMALSATVGNKELLRKWISNWELNKNDAVLVHSNFRPVPLKMGVFVHQKKPYVQYVDGTREYLSIYSKNPYVNAALNFAIKDLRTLVFRQSRKATKSTALGAAKWASEHRSSWNVKDSISVTNSDNGESLRTAIRHSTSFHHAGMDPKDKKIVEKLVRKGMIKVLSSTTTLSTGVNMPMTVGILEFLRYDSEVGAMMPIPKNECMQCLGRIGRWQFDDFGIALIFLNAEKMNKMYADARVEELLDKYLDGVPEPIVSKYYRKSNLQSAILRAVAGGYASTLKELESYLRKSLCYLQERRKLNRNADDCLYEMSSGKFPLIKIDDGNIIVTKIGKAVNGMYIMPKTAKILLNAAKRLVGDYSDISIAYWAALTPNFRRFYSRNSMKPQWKELLNSMQEELGIDVKDVFDENVQINALMTATVLVGTSTAPYAWIRETNIRTLESQWLIESGDLYSVVGGSGSADWILYAFSLIAKMVGNKELGEKCSILTKRVRYGVKKELLPLVDIRGVGRVRGRALYKFGFRSKQDVAIANDSDLAKVVVGDNRLGLPIARRLITQAKYLP